jgi:beta-lactamase class A
MRLRPGPIRREVLIGAGAMLAAGAGARAAVPDEPRFAAIEARLGGRLGVAVLDTASGRRLAHRADERFPMCSTFKWLAAAAVLARVDRGVERLDRRIAYSKADLLFTSPITSAHVRDGALPLGELCFAIVTRSDNAAANLVLRTLGGPAGLTRWLRSVGDRVTRLDHHEPELNNPPPGDPRDTTTPAQTVANLDRFLLKDAVLRPASRRRLSDWLIATRTGDHRIRAGVPAGWRVGDKTGAWNGVTANDLAIVWPPGKAPVLIAAYSTRGPAADGARDAALAEVARTAISILGLSA